MTIFSMASSLGRDSITVCFFREWRAKREDKEKTFEMVCSKARLPTDAWNDPKTRLEVFNAVVFGEPTEVS